MKPRHLQKLDGVVIPCHLHGLSRKLVATLTSPVLRRSLPGFRH